MFYIFGLFFDILGLLFQIFGSAVPKQIRYGPYFKFQVCNQLSIFKPAVLDISISLFFIVTFFPILKPTLQNLIKKVSLL